MDLSLQYSDSPEFWDFFHQKYWNQHPCVIKNVFPQGTLISTREVMASLHQARLDLENQENSSPHGIQFFVDLRATALNRAAAEWLPETLDVSLEEYTRSVSERVDHKDFGFFLNDFQSINLAAWKRARKFFTPLIERVGLPAGKSELNLFFSKYTKTPFGVHKDDADVFIIVLHGKKRLRVWPFQRFFHLLKKMVSPKHPQNLYLFDYTHELDGSLLLEAEAGDIIFWPASWWHIGEDPKADLTISIHHFMKCSGNVEKYFSHLFQNKPEFPTQPTWFQPHPFGSAGQIPQVITSMSQKLEKNLKISARKAAAVTWLSRKTALGYERTPPALRQVEIREEDVLSAENSILIEEIEDEIVIGAGGYAYCQKRDEGLKRVVETLNEGRPVSYAELISKYRSSAENKSPGSASQIVSEFLERLLRHHSIERLGPRP
ncbi:MAG: cupin domain-containing protein [Bdellovibrionales bacterium]|nr:cupin domain-containing protein [Bdellovibrionales bacterium]